MDFLFYNVENLMDIYDNPRKRDNDFTPNGRRKWTVKRYQKKINDLAQVISNYRGLGIPPDFIALCEIENIKVVEDLINEKGLNDTDYKIIHAESDDQRGIDICFIYKESSFTYESHKLISIDRHSRNKLHSRDIMSIKGHLPNKSEINILINHWPSRSDGEKLTRYKRAAAAKTVKEEVEGIFALDENAKIIICGDFNDDAPSFSLNNILKAGNKSARSTQLVNLGWDLFNDKKGTILHDNTWYLFDQFIVSHSLANRVVDKKINIVENQETLYFSSKNGKSKPNRTYLGQKYTGGVSDHLPVWITFE